MTHEELLTKYLDNSLTDSERAEFDHLVSTSPQFSRDVQELSKIEALLKEGPAVASVAPIAFLDNVENFVTEKIHQDKYHAADSSNGFTKLLSAMWILPVILLVGVGSYFMLRNNPAPETRVAQPQVTTPAQPQQTLPASPEIPMSIETPPQPIPAPNAEIQPKAQEEIIADQPTRNPDEMQGRIENPTSNSDKIALERIREKLNAARAEGKKATEAALLKQMGILAFKTGNSAEAKVHLTNSANIARELKLTQLQAESLGELGLIFKREGNSAAAAENFKKAIDLLKTGGQSSERWEKELN